MSFPEAIPAKILDIFAVLSRMESWTTYLDRVMRAHTKIAPEDIHHYIVDVWAGGDVTKIFPQWQIDLYAGDTKTLVLELMRPTLTIRAQHMQYIRGSGAINVVLPNISGLRENERTIIMSRYHELSFYAMELHSSHHSGDDIIEFCRLFATVRIFRLRICMVIPPEAEADVLQFLIRTP